MKLLKTTAIAALISFSIISNTNAQSWPAIAPIQNDDMHAITHPVTMMTSLNADVIDLGSGGYLRAGVYEEDPVSPYSGSLLFYLSNGYATVMYPIVDARHADLVLMHANPGYGCSHYCLLAVYSNKFGDVQCKRFDIINPGNASLGFGPIATWPLQFNGSSLHNSIEPHIDVFPDPVNTGCGGNKMRKAVATWSQDIGSGYNIYSSVIDLDGPNGNVFVTPALLIDQGVGSDVAAVTDKGTAGNPQTAYFIYYDRTKGSIKHADWDISTTTVNTYPALETGTFSYCPRIEAQSLGSKMTGTGQTPILWEAVAQVNQTGLEEVHAYGYNKSTGIISKDNYASSLSPINTYNHYLPAVATGQGGNTVGVPSAVGNNSFTIGWYMGTSNTIEALQISNALPSTVLAGFSQVNKTALGTGTIPASAFANSANSGNYLVSYWHTDLSTPSDMIGSKINTTFSFKTTKINEINNQGMANIYPNPVKDILHVYKADDCNYVITNIVGVNVLAGKLQNNEINTSSLTPGMYLLQLNKQGQNYDPIKFVKE
jgi:hypothetical protein